ncbi:NADH dehydrogenase [ubiquinone] 1 alpha subcomplex subunit 7-like isoform X2 [Ciona intestinalis]
MSKQTPIISMLTKYLGVRRNKMWLRYKEDMSPRTIPKPNLPPGSNSKLSGNYYYTRDARREMAPPVVLAENTSARLAPGVSDSSSVESTQTNLPTPGFSTKWTLSTDQPYLRK